MPVESGRRATDAINNNTSVTIYVAAIIILSLMAVATILAVITLRPEADNAPIIAAVLGFITPTNLSLMALVQRENHKTLNSRLDQLMALGKNEAFLAGTIKGATVNVSPEAAQQLSQITSKVTPDPPSVGPR